jgi:hypothetical protein
MSEADRVKVVEDFCYEEFENLDEGLEWIRTKGVEVRLLQESGSGGGWPVIELSGSREAVTRLLKESWNASDNDLVGRFDPA